MHKLLLTLCIVIVACTSKDPIDAYSASLQKNPLDCDARLGLSKAYERKGMRTEANAQYESYVACSKEKQ